MKSEVLDAKLLPFDPDSGEPILPRQQPGYYRGLNTLAQKPFWDEATRKLVKDRVGKSEPIRFFTQQQADFWSIVFDHLIPQTDRTPDRRIPILPVVDKRLYFNQTNGYRFADMPHDRDAYLLGAEAIDEEARHQCGADFSPLPHLQQDVVLKAIHDGKPKAAAHIWKRMPVHRFWQLIIHDAIDAYYAHPWVWDEIGFGGPAYPRAYIRLERGEPEPWEVEEQPYAWVAPSEAVSGESETTHEFHTESLQNRSHSNKAGVHRE